MQIAITKNFKKLVVNRASSTENEIRFYINSTQYFNATYENGEYFVEFKEEVKEKSEKKSKFQKFKETVDLILFIGISLILMVLMTAAISLIIDNAVVVLFIMSLSPIFIDFATTLVGESRRVSMKQRSKHSAEHMMVNFLENNKRLPKSIEEVKSSSRFCNDCGSRNLIVAGTVEYVFSKIVAFIITLITSSICSHFLDSKEICFFVMIAIFFLVSIITTRILKKYERFNPIIQSSNLFLSKLIQRVNTTSKVKNEDIILAYCSAKAWIKVVYPEYYNEDEDVFIENLEGHEEV